MIKRINSTEQIFENLTKEGKFRELNAPEDIKAVLEMNKQMEDIRRDYKIKDQNSQISASKVILTA